MSVNEEQVSRINEGRLAAVCLQWLNPILLRCEANAVARLKNAYRGGQANQLADGVAALTVLEDLRTEITKIAKMGESASKQLIEGEEDGESNED